MPRRPRPASRKAPRGGTSAVASHDTSTFKAPRSVHKRKPPSPEPPSDSEESEAFSDQPDDTDDDKESEESDVDIDAPRVAQWVDEEDIDNLSGGDESEGSEDEEEDLGVGPSDLKGLRNDLSSLPLGALRKAQQTLSRAKVIDHSDSEEDQSGAEETEDWESGPEEEESGRPADRTDIAKKKEIEKRRNKHAPMEMTSKRPVPRKKIVIEEKRPVPRDPRFLPITGEFSADKFRTQYGFLSDLHETEMKTLKDNLKRARRMLASSPRDQRAEREAEVQRLERAVKRAESQVNRDKREKVEASALKRVRQEEKEKQKQGKRAWFMKDADKKELLVRAKFDALAESGGRGAVKKAIEKKQKKVSQKEKKKRPFAPGAGAGPRRPAYDAGGQRPHKRQKFA